MTTTTVTPVARDSQHAAVGVEIALYVRVSTVEQAEEGISLDSQEAALRRYAEQRWPDARVMVYREEGKSAREGKKRPLYEQLKRRVDDGRVAAIVGHSTDRLARSVADYLKLWNLCYDSGTELHTVTQGQAQFDAFGKFNAQMLSAVAELESGIRSERTTRNVNYLLAREVARPHLVRSPPRSRRHPGARRALRRRPRRLPARGRRGERETRRPHAQ